MREKAGKVLGGLLHCSFLSPSASETLLQQFTKEVAGRLRRKPRKDQDPADFQTEHGKALLLRHAGVLGLSSFVVSCPYEVMPSLPFCFMLLIDASFCCFLVPAYILVFANSCPRCPLPYPPSSCCSLTTSTTPCPSRPPSRRCSRTSRGLTRTTGRSTSWPSPRTSSPC